MAGVRVLGRGGGHLHLHPGLRHSLQARLLCSAPPPKKEGEVVEEGREGKEGKEEGREYSLASGAIRPKLHTPTVTTRPLNFEEAREVGLLPHFLLLLLPLLPLPQVAVRALAQQRSLWAQRVEDLRAIFGGQADAPRTAEQEWYYKRVSFWMKR